jgi:hypothetical protein
VAGEEVIERHELIDIFSICRGAPLRSPVWAGARPCPYHE